MKEREQFGSKIGFILVSAGCAIGLVMYGSFHTYVECTEGQLL